MLARLLFLKNSDGCSKSEHYGFFFFFPPKSLSFFIHVRQNYAPELGCFPNRYKQNPMKKKPLKCWLALFEKQ
jgi:hypothetical protein